MFSLIQGYRDLCLSAREVRILILGLDGSGKTTALEQIKSTFRRTNPLPFDKIMPTSGLNLGVVKIGEVRAVFWDVGGHRKMRTVWSNYFRDVHCIVFVIDVSNTQRYNEATSSLFEILEHNALKRSPILVLVNKSDVSDDYTVAPLEVTLKTMNAKGKRHFRVQRCSAYTRDGLVAPPLGHCLETL